MKKIIILAVLSTVTSIWASPKYEALIPYYYEVCSVSQVVGLDGDVGGGAGHALTYIKGACRDTSAGYPRLKMCDDNKDGVSVSVNKLFKNVNWVAVDGRDMMLSGGLNEGEVVSRDNWTKVVSKVVESGAYKGIKFHAQYAEGFDPEKKTEEQFLVERSIGTDFAVNFGRNAYCGKIPLTQRQMTKVIEYLNTLNESYATTGKDYNWSGVKNNCTHTIRNALASIGYGTTRRVDQGYVRQIFNLALPSNEIVRVGKLVSEKPSSNVRKVWNDKSKRKAILVGGSLSSAPGGILELSPMMLEGNEMFGKSEKMTTMSIPLLRPRAKQLKNYLSNPEVTDLSIHMQAKKEQFSKALEELPMLENLGKKNNKEFSNFYEEYKKYLEASLELTEKFTEE